ncbi:N-alpha-acetyltransferase 40 isoform X2 [Stegostoma tigrinum]|uniref:N-alpha-acetyltransferase 40 isoform X2 n=1 Tax=Stegostoma tigrinum TaxID=3053191 RepID=UPI00202B0C7B|nr:N-alpha-acetyltransferase 40 isoform X2 [Stegostoma tigrinum]
MGRKSSKAKEKKQRRLEERAAMDAVCAKVETANKIDDPLASFPAFKKYDRNGMNIVIECKRVTDLDPSTVDWAVELTKTNMQTMYEQSEWGWKDREKKEEMTDERAWYLVAREGDSAVPTAFSHFRFDVECGEEVLYWYSCVILNGSPAEGGSSNRAQGLAGRVAAHRWRGQWRPPDVKLLVTGSKVLVPTESVARK